VWVLGVSERGSGVWLSARERGSRERGVSMRWLGLKPGLGGKGARGPTERPAAGQKLGQRGTGEEAVGWANRPKGERERGKGTGPWGQR